MLAVREAPRTVGGAGGEGGAVGGAGPDCAGDWGMPELLFEGGTNLSSPSITLGERALFFSATIDNEDSVFVMELSSVAMPFADPVAVPSLKDLCADDERPAVDLSEDGLRAYVTCGLLFVDPGVVEDGRTIGCCGRVPACRRCRHDGREPKHQSRWARAALQHRRRRRGVGHDGGEAISH